jgi:hypothetical protein
MILQMYRIDGNVKPGRFHPTNVPDSLYDRFMSVCKYKRSLNGQKSSWNAHAKVETERINTLERIVEKIPCGISVFKCPNCYCLVKKAAAIFQERLQFGYVLRDRRSLCLLDSYLRIWIIHIQIKSFNKD